MIHIIVMFLLFINSLRPLANMELTEYNLSENGILIGKYFADENGIEIGDFITITRARDKKSKTFVVEYI